MDQTTVKGRQQSRELAAQNKAARFAQITEAASDVYLAATNGGNIAGALEAASAMQKVREAFDSDIMAMVKPLLNTPLGIVTDRPPGAKDRQGNPLKPYHDDTIRDCCIEGALKGVQLIGNHINIIAGRCYIAKAGWEYLIKSKVQGLKWWKPEFGVPKTMSNGAIVSCKCTWKIDNREGSLTADIPVKTDSFTGVDGIIGKAARKFYKRVYEAMTGILISDPDEPATDIIENEATQDETQTDQGPEKSTVQQSAAPNSGIQKEMDPSPEYGNQSKAD